MTDQNPDGITEEDYLASLGFTDVETTLYQADASPTRDVPALWLATYRATELAELEDEDPPEEELHE